MSNNEEINEQVEEQVQFTEDEEVKVSKPNPIVANINKWYKSQNKTLVLGVGALIIAIGAWAAYKYLYQKPREEKGTIAIYKTQALFDVDSYKLVLKTAPKLAEQYSGTKSGNIAAYMAGTSYLYTGDFKNAIKYLEKVSFDDRIMGAQVIGVLGDAYIENKEIDKGLSLYLKAAKKAETDFAINWYLKAAMVHKTKNEWKEALDIYRSLKKEYFGAQDLRDIEKLIGEAEAKTGDY